MLSTARNLVAKHLLYHPTLAWQRLPVPRHLRVLRQSERWPSARLAEWQLERLRALVAFAAAEVPFYRECLPRWSGDGLYDLDDLRKLPFMTKQILRERPEAVRSRRPLGKLHLKTTAGSTGEPFQLWKTADALAWELAATWRAYGWVGVVIGDRQARFWGVPLTAAGRRRARLIDFVCHRRRCSAFAWDDSTMRGFTRELRVFGPQYFYGYVSMLEAYARHFQRTREAFPFQLKCVIATSEILTASTRALLGEVFRAPVYDEYGSGEVGTVAHECERGGLHLSAENMIVEILDGERPCAPGELGEIVLTELNNRATPLIRYRTGDLARFAAAPCACGRTLPCIKEICGRAWDMVLRRDGRLFHPALFLYIFEEAKEKGLGIGMYRITQTALDSFLIEIVPEPGYGAATEDFLSAKLRAAFDPQVRLTFARRHELAREESGKLRQVIGLSAGRPTAR